MRCPFLLAYGSIDGSPALSNCTAPSQSTSCRHLLRRYPLLAKNFILYPR